MRISVDLGLHLDLISYVQDGRLTAQELDVRRTTFWGVFVHDKSVAPMSVSGLISAYSL